VKAAETSSKSRLLKGESVFPSFNGTFRDFVVCSDSENYI